ncbi:MAG TPA: hypothetical protein VHE30_14175 [Polyangiaceae bacterium]|nr:hypothetical protein [Polyangiaceae bacterium]
MNTGARKLVKSCVVAFTLGGVALSVAALAAPSGKTSFPECLTVWGEARYRNYGYDHIVHLDNRCDSAAVCEVSTNVNPVPERAVVPPKQAVEVLTFRGSPSRDFVPKADCRLTGN